MRSVADGSSASGPSANGRSRLTEARCHSGLVVGSRQMSSRGYDGMLPTFQKRTAGRRDGEIQRAMRAESSDGQQRQQEMSAGSKLTANMDKGPQHAYAQLSRGL